MKFAGMEVAGTGIFKYWNLQVLELVSMEFAGMEMAGTGMFLRNNALISRHAAT